MDISAQNTLGSALSTLTKGQSDKALEQSLASMKTMEGRKLDAAAKDFEAVFLSQMLSHMFAGIETDGMFGGGHSEDIYRSMMVQEYGKILAESGGIGLSDALKAEIIAMQEGQKQ